MKNILSRHSVNEKLSNIFINRFGLDLETVANEDFDRHLLGNVFRLAPRDLVYIYMDIEREFGISIPDEAVTNGALATINGTIDLICSQLYKIEQDAV